MTDFSSDNRAAPSSPGTFAPPHLRRDDAPGGPSDRDPTPAPGGPAAPGGPSASGGPGGPGAPLPQPNRGLRGPGGPGGPGQPGAPANGTQRMAEVKGRIEVADEVVEKVAGLAAIEVDGVADLGGDIERALESVRDRIGIGQKRGDQGVKARINGRDVAIDVTIVIEYGHVVMDVARQVKRNVASQANRMLGLRVVEVNVTVDDVKMPKRRAPEARDDYGYDERTDGGFVPLEG
jgi:uncharacterized alkaline shock family protein YloU